MGVIHYYQLLMSIFLYLKFNLKSLIKVIVHIL